MAAKAAVIGIDIGVDTACVAFCGKGIVDIVQNEVSKRITPSLVGFNARERLLGDSALAQIRSNAKSSCRGFKHLLGQKADAQMVEIEKFWSTAPLATAADGFAGYDITYKGETRVFSSPQVAAMFLTKLREITEKWCDTKVADVVIGVPSYFSDVHRQALLDAAAIANISVLRLMNEHTATALAYGIYRSNSFDAEKPCITAFCSMGHSMFSVSVVQFVKGKLNVVCEASDKVGGRDMNECLMRAFAEQFKKKTGCDVLSNKKASYKLEDAVEKTKKVLSANYEAPCSVECLMEDEDFSSLMKREDFEHMCAPMMDRVRNVLVTAKAKMGMPLDKLDFVEVVGGASRVPWLKSMIQDAFGGHELSFTMNADESVARGCALQAAMLSPLYKVRDFKVEDTSPFGINIHWISSAADAEASKEDENEVNMAGKDGESKTAAVFPAGSAMGMVKILTFHRKGPFDIGAKYVDDAPLVPGTSRDLGNYRIELPVSAEVKRVKVRAKLTLSGIFTIESAQVLEKEEYEEKVKEKRELPAEEKTEEPAEQPKPADGEQKEEGTEKKEEKPKEPEKKYEWVDVVKKKQRTKTTNINITKTGTPGLASMELLKRTDEETAMQSEMREIIETDERRNDLESYILNTRDKIATSGVWGPYVADQERDSFSSALMKAEDWLYDNFEATKLQYVEKMNELKQVGDPIAWRANEDNMRNQWIQAVVGTVENYRGAAEQPGDKYGHIAQDKLASIITKCDGLKAWLHDMKMKQEAMPKTVKPILLCADMEKKNHELAKFADEILKEPKPAPPKEEKKEETKTDAKPPAAGTEANEASTGNANDID